MSIYKPLMISDFSQAVHVPMDGIIAVRECLPEIDEDVDRILISPACLDARIKALADQIRDHYHDHGELVMITLLDGARPFSDALQRCIGDIPGTNVRRDTLRVKSYDGTASTGRYEVLKHLDIDIKGKHALVIEDIIDTGGTLVFVNDYLRRKDPGSIQWAALLDKKVRPQMPRIKADFTGFIIPHEFVIGFGLDKDDDYRDLPYVGVYGG
ncbi:hypoxanthine phosphoribosyltransferase [Candidatus Woesearchaeota archaeon]|nr:hypoxanthine phosphoribosyltransferase [Candidatus Woesearchaeota archaeon]